MRKILRFLAWLVVAAAGIFLAVQLSFLARVWWWRDHNPSSTAFMEARLKVLQAKDREAKLRHSWQPYDRIAVSLKRAVVVAEDAKFSDHEGFDWEAIEKAREKNRKKGKVVAGGSTISQQLAKNLFLSGERSALRKGQEALITVMIPWRILASTSGASMRSRSNGPPGASRIMKNATVMTTNSVGIAPASRLREYRHMDQCIERFGSTFLDLILRRPAV